MASKTLSRKTAIVTGASSGIGYATALALASAGANLVVGARRMERLNSLVEKIEAMGASALAIRTNVRELSDVDSLVLGAKKKFGGVDIFVNSAGIMPLSLLRKMRVAEWLNMIDINFKGAVHVVSAILPTFLEQKYGHLVFVSSIASKKIIPGSAIYSACSSAIRTLAEGIRMELSPFDQIKITLVETGYVQTELFDSIEDEEIKRSIIGELGTISPLKAEEVASAILYALCQPPHVDINEIVMRPTMQAL
ncbi:NAD(P)-dependent oxidoreductase [Candidatus Methylacidiphilum fumarolicum]|uniref:Short-chain alcohol dehydrogenase n=2 Tax=Candidatus Methylacidiphilum fumarolicum TaxID=591154 RepID=I0K059_METFB|nr:SDR family oxidoreductase [Candidatus Methylacidiphilum fumarolicum]MBW6414272.1 SDR family oxidoreductase [Candidatus Methylacidiphilum fumarolicum]TFE70960.1 oxidoreductase [Candidatus Methylacidiphilum fumarolicum]TFE71374.1 NAD(P)-dependent oxidoreductase [Candidatus Methylacidiphilum fumarolicum]TFE74416.1 NAD(P)-dependent oxidoreductase [Candidatus Methylacidiphilum fumarolicum]TFE76847.1 oxidoreductase [Candidatus Methylacidiphilum fumarolicum]